MNMRQHLFCILSLSSSYKAVVKRNRKEKQVLNLRLYLRLRLAMACIHLGLTCGYVESWSNGLASSSEYTQVAKKPFQGRLILYFVGQSQIMDVTQLALTSVGRPNSEERMSLRLEQNWKWSSKTFLHTLSTVNPWYETTCCGICLVSDANLHCAPGGGEGEVQA